MTTSVESSKFELGEKDPSFIYLLTPYSAHLIQHLTAWLEWFRSYQHVTSRSCASEVRRAQQACTINLRPTNKVAYYASVREYLWRKSRVWRNAGQADFSASVGDQHRGGPTAVRMPNAPNPVNANPFEEPERRMSEYTAMQVATLQARLDRKLGPEYISSRPGAAGQKVHYLSADKCINLANEVFGFNGWSSSIQRVDIDFVGQYE